MGMNSCFVPPADAENRSSDADAGCTHSAILVPAGAALGSGSADERIIANALSDRDQASDRMNWCVALEIFAIPGPKIGTCGTQDWYTINRPETWYRDVGEAEVIG